MAFALVLIGKKRRFWSDHVQLLSHGGYLIIHLQDNKKHSKITTTTISTPLKTSPAR